MYMKLNKALFARNDAREKEFGHYFNKTSSGLSYIMALAVTVFFTPALIATSLFSKEAIVILANFSLSLGYLSNFAYRIYQNEVSKAELLVSGLTLTVFLIIAYFTGPPVALLSFFAGTLGFVNQMATAVNLFFLIKHVIVPPCKKFIENIAQAMGFDIAGRYYTKPPLTLNQDRYIIDLLMMKTYGHDSYSPEFNELKLACFNKLLLRLCEYIDKYDESILGYIKNKEDITDLENQIAQLTTKGNADGGLSFIKKKIGFKTTKIHMLEAAKYEVTLALADPLMDPTKALHFFRPVTSIQLKTNRQQLLHEGVHCLETEILRQRDKIASLKDCMPQPSVGI